MQLTAEIFGALAVLVNIIGYRQHNMNRYRLVSALALSLLSVHFLLLDAMAAFILLVLSVARNLLAMRWQSIWLVLVFAVIALGFWGWEWFIKQHPWYIAFAYISTLVFAVGTVLLKDTHKLRQWFLLAESLGLTYAIIVGSIFGSVFHIFNLSTILVTLYQKRARGRDS